MPAEFQGSSFLLTFPQSSLNKDTLFTYLTTLPSISFVKLAQETHNDGSGAIHFHAVLHFSSKQRFNQTFFDASGEHPNIKPVGRKCSDWSNVIKYLEKEDASPLEWGTPRHERSVWAQVINASSRNEAEQLIREEKPRDAVLNAKNLDYFLDKMFPMRAPSSTSFRSPDEFVLPDNLHEWCAANYRMPRPERPRSLVLVGASRQGKTAWARCLGPHAYVANQWNLDSFDGLPSTFWHNGYVVFDDIDWDTLKSSAKSWLGAQRDFSVSDKYRRKRRIPGGIPSILLVNPEDYCGELSQFCNGPWGKENIDVVILDNKLY